VDFLLRDFNGADSYFAGVGAPEWADIEAVLTEMKPHFQPSDQARKIGSPIFDPKGTNAALNRGVRARGWMPVPVPEELTMFGLDWDAGKASTLAEWQFSNYPFLWNNVIRTEAVVVGDVQLSGVGTTEALIVVTKSGGFPASNSTLYYEQAEAQLDAVLSKGAFSLPVRLVGLTVPVDAEEIDAVWSTYSGRYARTPRTRADVKMAIRWGTRARKYGTRPGRFSLLP
jgi:hypothetical protein